MDGYDDHRHRFESNGIDHVCTICGLNFEADRETRMH